MRIGIPLALFIVVAALVATGVTYPVDAAVLLAIQAPGSQPLDVIASVATTFGSVEVTGAIAIAVAIVWWRREGVLGLVPLLLFVGVVLELALKRIVPEPAPPPDLLRTIPLLPLLEAPSRFAFPSGHALRATFLAVLFADRWPRARPWLYAAALLVMLTRVYLGAHWPSDVLGGVLLGVALAAFAELLRRRSA